MRQEIFNKKCTGKEGVGKQISRCLWFQLMLTKEIEVPNKKKKVTCGKITHSLSTS